MIRREIFCGGCSRVQAKIEGRLSASKDQKRPGTSEGKFMLRFLSRASLKLKLLRRPQRNDEISALI